MLYLARLSLRWVPQDPYEDTDTLVLSVANHFLDIRVKKDRSRIDWAFAGTKRIEEGGRHVWTHSIDSRGWQDEDSGFVTILDNGDELEQGSMKNPDAGNQMMKHEEIWRCLELEKERGYVAMRRDENAWVAYVDGHLLELVHDSNGFSVARFAKSRSGSWYKVLSMGTSRVFVNVDDTAILNLASHSEWRLLASQGLNGS